MKLQMVFQPRNGNNHSTYKSYDNLIDAVNEMVPKRLTGDEWFSLNPKVLGLFVLFVISIILFNDGKMIKSIKKFHTINVKC